MATNKPTKTILTAKPQKPSLYQLNIKILVNESFRIRTNSYRAPRKFPQATTKNRIGLSQFKQNTITKNYRT